MRSYPSSVRHRFPVPDCTPPATTYQRILPRTARFVTTAVHALQFFASAYAHAHRPTFWVYAHTGSGLLLPLYGSSCRTRATCAWFYPSTCYHYAGFLLRCGAGRRLPVPGFIHLFLPPFFVRFCVGFLIRLTTTYPTFRLVTRTLFIHRPTIPFAVRHILRSAVLWFSPPPLHATMLDSGFVCVVHYPPTAVVLFCVLVAVAHPTTGYLHAFPHKHRTLVEPYSYSCLCVRSAALFPVIRQ